jgi:uncharacterized Tic20 family protein
MENQTSPPPFSGETAMSPELRRLYSIRMWAALSPLLALLLNLYFCNIIVPAILFLCFKDTTPQAVPFFKRVLNFQISWTIWLIVGCIILMLIAGVGFFLTSAGHAREPGVAIFWVPVLLWVLLVIAYMIVFLVFTIIMLVRANSRPDYVPPLTIRFFKD